MIMSEFSKSIYIMTATEWKCFLIWKFLKLLTLVGLSTFFFLTLHGVGAVLLRVDGRVSCKRISMYGTRGSERLSVLYHEFTTVL